MKPASKKRAVKGMTLVEIIISMVIFAIISLMLVHIGNAINNLHKNSVRVSKRLTVEKPYAISGIYNAADDNVDAVTDNMKIVMTIEGKEVAIKGGCYATKADGTDKNTFSNADLQFVNIDVSKHMEYEKDGEFIIVKDTHGNRYKRKGTDLFEMDGVTPVTGVTIADVENSVADSNLWKAAS